jgi:PAS domain S-box-containing protein
MAEGTPGNGKRFLPLRLKLLLAYGSFFLLTFIALYFNLIYAVTDHADKQVKDDLVDTMTGAAAGVDTDLLLALAATGEPNPEGFSNDPRYLALIEWLDTIHQAEPDAWPFLYLRGETPEEIVIVVDLHAIYNAPHAAGILQVERGNIEDAVNGLEEPTFRHGEGPFVRQLREWSAANQGRWIGALQSSMADFLESSGIDPPRDFGIYKDQFGRWATAYMPLTSPTGEKVAGIGVDYQADIVEAVRADAQSRVLDVMLYSIPLGLLFLYLLLNRFVNPVKSLIQIARKIPKEDQPVSFHGIRETWMFDEVDILAQVLEEMVVDLRKRERRYHAVISTQNTVVIRSSPEGEFTFYNQAYLDLRGEHAVAEQASITGEGIHPEDRQAALKFLSEEVPALTPEIPECSHEMRIYDQHQRLRWMIWTVTGIYDREGSLLEYQVMGQDITPLKETQQKLEQANQRLRDISRDLITAQERERTNLAREIHDDLLNYLSEILLDLDGDVPADLVRETYLQIADRLRNSIYELRPPMLAYSLYHGLDDYLDHLQRRIKDETRVVVEVKNSGSNYEQEVKTQLFRIVQQACENAVEHAGASEIKVSGQLLPDKADLQISDNGRGFRWEGEQSVNDSVRQKRFGLAGIFERGVIIGAEVQISSASEEGTCLSVRWYRDGRSSKK